MLVLKLRCQLGLKLKHLWNHDRSWVTAWWCVLRTIQSPLDGAYWEWYNHCLMVSIKDKLAIAWWCIFRIKLSPFDGAYKGYNDHQEQNSRLIDNTFLRTIWPLLDSAYWGQYGHLIYGDKMVTAWWCILRTIRSLLDRLLWDNSVTSCAY